MRSQLIPALKNKPFLYSLKNQRKFSFLPLFSISLSPLSLSSSLFLFYSYKTNNGMEKAIDMLIQHKIVQSDAKAIADYLFSNTKIDKAAMGDYLSEKNDFNFQVLDCFLSNLNFKSLEFDESLRYIFFSFLLSLRLKIIIKIKRKKEISPHLQTTRRSSKN